MASHFQPTLNMLVVAVLGIAACGSGHEAPPGAGGGTPARAPAAMVSRSMAAAGTPGNHRCAMMVYRHCDGPGGGPPCETAQRRPDDIAIPPITDAVTQATWPQHQPRFANWALALGHCGAVEPQFDAEGKLAELWLGSCVSAQRFQFAFSDCP